MAFFGNNCKNMINLSSISPKDGYISHRKHLFLHLYRIFAGYSPIKSGTFSRLDCLDTMNRKYLSYSIFMRNILIVLLAIGICACANIGRPGGGPKDETPPVLKKATPESGTLNWDKTKVSLVFDEIVLVENASEKVVISPPQKQMPRITAQGKSVTVQLNDSLIPNTTYTIDFSDAIVDNNEKNKLLDFSVNFATGDHIDTLEMGGVLLNASNLEPITNMLVGIYANPDDTMFTKQPFLRIALSDEYGRFTVRNMAEGSYRIFALKDGNRNYFFDNATEDIAFLDSIYTPTVEMKWHSDTLWVDSVTIDTITTSLRPHFYPDNIVLRAFNENYKAAYFEKYERTDRRKVTLYFSAPQDSFPVITPLNFDADDWAVIESSATRDTISYWLRDSMAYNKDTLRLVASYYRTDTTQQLSLYNDTMTWNYREKNVRREKRKKDNDTLPPPIEFINIDSKLGSMLDIYASPAITFAQPLAHLDTDAVHLDMHVDTTWVPVQGYTFAPDSGSTRVYRLYNKWKSGAEYRFTLDSVAATGIYGIHTNKSSQTFKIKTVEEYSNLVVKTAGVQDHAFVELITDSDMPAYTVPVKKGRAVFRYINPGTYYIRLCIDTNDNGKWDTGNYNEHRQPEEVYYYPGNVSLRANWDIEQNWDVYALPLDQQKPREIVKNKPKEEKQTEEEVEEEQPMYSNQPTISGGRNIRQY